VIVPLTHATDAAAFGGKASHLAAATAAGLPVPSGFALAWDATHSLAGDDAALAACATDLLARLRPPLAVRSSAIGEDSADASFAGQHRTELGLTDPARLAGAIRAVHASAFGESALAYRRRLGIDTPPRIGIVVQRLVPATCAGVLFTRNPVTGADERVIEAGWGLGEAVVAGLITPDYFRLARDGRLLEQRAGEKDIALRPGAGGVQEEAVPAELVAVPCLDAQKLMALHALALRCEAAFGAAIDLEWAFDGATLFLLQHRPITRTAPA
jgi:pyruvate, water dikinase